MCARVRGILYAEDTTRWRGGQHWLVNTAKRREIVRGAAHAHKTSSRRPVSKPRACGCCSLVPTCGARPRGTRTWLWSTVDVAVDNGAERTMRLSRQE